MTRLGVFVGLDPDKMKTVARWLVKLVAVQWLLIVALLIELANRTCS